MTSNASRPLRMFFSLSLLASAFAVYSQSACQTQSQDGEARNAAQDAKQGGLNQAGADPLDSGIDSGVYTNHFFGFSLKYPKDWALVSAPTSSASPSGNPAPAAGGKAPSASAATQNRLFGLLLVVEQAPAKPPAQWRRVQIMATKLNDPAISIEEHLKAGTQFLKNKNSPVRMVGLPEPEVIAGRQFWKQRMTQQENGLLYHIEMLAIKSKGYVLQFALWGLDDNGAKDLEPVLQTLKFTGDPG